MSYSYNIVPTPNPLSSTELVEGINVCFSNVTTNPNNIGFLESSKKVPGAKGIWTAVINGVREYFDAKGVRLVGSGFSGNPCLYGVLSNGEIDPTRATSRSRGAQEQGHSDTVSLTYMTPKDYFACEALNALLQKIDNPLSMSDGTIASIAAKCYKIAQAMAVEAYGSRENDNASSPSGDYVVVDKNNLQNDTDRLLYNINESIKANTESITTNGIKVSNIDEVEFDGTPNIRISNSDNDPVNIKDVDAI